MCSGVFTSPLVGEVGIASEMRFRVRGSCLSKDLNPSPQPSPTRGEGAHCHCGYIEARPGMTGRHTSAFPRRKTRPEYQKVALRIRGRRKRRACSHTRSLACSKKTRELVTTGRPNHPAFPARWCYGFLRDLPGEPGFIATIAGGNSANLTPASGCQDHTSIF